MLKSNALFAPTPACATEGSSGQLLPLLPEGCTSCSSELHRSKCSSCSCCGCCCPRCADGVPSRPGTASENDTCRCSGWCCWCVLALPSLASAVATAAPVLPLGSPGPPLTCPFARGAPGAAARLPALWLGVPPSLGALRSSEKLRSTLLALPAEDDEKLVLILCPAVKLSRPVVPSSPCVLKSSPMNPKLLLLCCTCVAEFKDWCAWLKRAEVTSSRMPVRSVSSWVLPARSLPQLRCDSVCWTCRQQQNRVARCANPQICQCGAHSHRKLCGCLSWVTEHALAWDASLAGVCSSPVLLLLLLLRLLSLCLTCRLKATASSASWKATVHESPCAQHQRQHIHSHDALHILTAPGNTPDPRLSTVAQPVPLTHTQTAQPSPALPEEQSAFVVLAVTRAARPLTHSGINTLTSLSLHELHSTATNMLTHTDTHTYTRTHSSTRTSWSMMYPAWLCEALRRMLLWMPMALFISTGYRLVRSEKSFTSVTTMLTVTLSPGLLTLGAPLDLFACGSSSSSSVISNHDAGKSARGQQGTCCKHRRTKPLERPCTQGRWGTGMHAAQHRSDAVRTCRILSLSQRGRVVRYCHQASSAMISTAAAATTPTMMAVGGWWLSG